MRRSPLDLEQRVHDRVKAPVAGQQRGVAGGAVPEAEVLSDRHLRRAERPDEHVVDEALRRARCEGLLERDHDQLGDPQRGDQLSLARQRREQPGVCCGATTDTGWGSKVSTLSEPSITSRWPR